MKKVWTYVLVIVLCVGTACSGVFCGVKWFQRAHRESHIIGQLNIDNSYVQESFSFSAAKHPIAFYHDDYDDTELYTYDEELEAVPSFDGDKKQYEIVLNDYLILEPTVLFRAVNFRVNMNFRDVDGSMLCETYYDVTIRFFEDKTEFHIEMNGDQNRQYIERYIQFNGFELFINEITTEAA